MTELLDKLQRITRNNMLTPEEDAHLRHCLQSTTQKIRADHNAYATRQRRISWLKEINQNPR